MRRAVVLPAVVAVAYVLALLFLLDRVEPAPLELPPPSATPAPPAPVDSERRFAGAPLTRAVHYSGRESPLTFWNSDLSGLDRDFARIRNDGFDAVVLAIPWGEFQPTLFPPKESPRAFRRLEHVLRAARRHRLGVVARVSAARDVEPAAQLPGRDRMRFVYADENVYRAWRSYIAALGRTLTASPSFRFAFLSWEDFWGVVVDAQTTTSDDVRRRLALDTGFDSYLSARFSLAELADHYGRPLDTWRDVRVGAPGTGGFDLFVDFVSRSLVERFYRPARRELPHLSLEPPPPTVSGSGAGLPAGAFATVSFSPATGGAGDATAVAALRRLAVTLRDARRRSRGLVFVGRLGLGESAAQVGAAPGLGPAQLPTFVRCSAPLLRRHTLGYAVPAYRGGVANTVFNASFALGGDGWRLRGGARAVRAGEDGRLRLPPDARASQAVPRERDPGAAAAQDVVVALVARASSRQGARLTIRLGGVSRTIRVPPDEGRIQLTFPAARLATYDLTLAAAGGGAVVDEAAVYTVVEPGVVDGPGADPALSAIRALNEALEDEGQPERSAECAGTPRR